MIHPRLIKSCVVFAIVFWLAVFWFLSNAREQVKAVVPRHEFKSMLGESPGQYAEGAK